jgi:carbonic anhydrase/acetyltransferase-like protein (isoleucine patch superfamily)
VGHAAILHCKKIGNNVLIGNNATVLDNAEIGDYCIIAAGSLVSPGTILPSESFAAGVPAQVKGKISQNQKDYITIGSAFNIELAQKYKKQGL